MESGQWMVGSHWLLISQVKKITSVQTLKVFIFTKLLSPSLLIKKVELMMQNEVLLLLGKIRLFKQKFKLISPASSEY